jgi:replicative DNA helicase
MEEERDIEKELEELVKMFSEDSKQQGRNNAEEVDCELERKINNDEALKFLEDSYNKSVNLQQMKAEIEEIVVSEKYEKTIQRREIQEELEKIDIGYEAPVEDLLSRIEDDYRHRKKNVPFLTPQFGYEVPLFPSQLILMGARSGAGKSSACLAITQNSLMYNKRVLVILNEEDRKDFYLRLACYLENKSYSSIGRMDKAEQEKLTGRVQEALNSGMLKVIDNNYFGKSGATTTKEGLGKILESLQNSEVRYDQIIIDYFQKFANTHNVYQTKSFSILKDVSYMLDEFKNEYEAEIILFAQLKPAEKKLDFEKRIKEGTLIYNVCTCAIEIEPEYENNLTHWIFRKHRLNGSIVGKKITTRFDKGKHREYTITDDLEITLKKFTKGRE